MNNPHDGSPIHCECGVSLFVSAKGRLVSAIEKDKPTFQVEGVSKKPDTESTPSVGEKTIKKNRGLIYGGLATLVLLMVAFGTFLLRTPPVANGPADALTTAPSSDGTKASAVTIKPIDIVAGTLRRLATEVPVPMVASGVTNSDESELVAAIKPSKKAANPKRKISPYGEQTVAPIVVFPAKSEPRLRLPVVEAEASRQFFSDAYGRAFQSYEAFIELDESAKDLKPYPQRLSQTLANVKAAFALAGDTDNAAKRNELLYLLAFLSLKAGHLEEAMVYGEMAARFGDPKEQASRDAAFISLSAAQEAVATHWGVPGSSGELQQIRAIGELVDEDWPDEPQRDAIWMTLAQSYAAFGHFDLAIDAYSAIKPDSSEFVDAQIAIGNAYWTLFLIEASEPDAVAEKMLERLRKATASLDRGVSSIENSETKPTLALVSAKLTLATIADRTGDYKTVITRLTKGKFPLIGSIRVNDPGAAKTVLVSRAFAKNAFLLMYQSKVNADDQSGASASLATMQEVLGDEADEQLSKLYLSLAVHLVNKWLSQKEITMANVKSLDQTLTAIRTNSSDLSVEDELWIAQSWSKLGNLSSAANVSQACFSRAIKIANQLLSSGSVPKTSEASVNMLLADWLRQSGKVRESLNAILQILAETPNVVDLQRQAALTLEDLAISTDSEVDLRKAIKGADAITDTVVKSELSAAWGWSKLAQKLHQLRYSDRGTEQTAELLIESHFHLARCRWMLMKVLPAGPEKVTLRKQTLQQLASARLAIVEGSETKSTWLAAFDKLDEKLHE